MKNKARLVLLVLIATLLPLTSFSEKNPNQEVYSAIYIQLDGSGQPVQLKIYIESYTPDDEVNQLATTLKNEGSDALSKAVSKMTRGRIVPGFGVGTDVAVIRSKPGENGGQIITMFTDRPIGFVEAWSNSRSSTYPFGILQMKLNKDGKGDGELIGAAQVSISADNTIHIEQLGTKPARLESIKKMK